MNNEDRGIEINLLQLVKRLLENAKYIIIVTCIFGVLGYVGSTMFNLLIAVASTSDE